jgi:hypothetical protein
VKFFAVALACTAGLVLAGCPPTSGTWYYADDDVEVVDDDSDDDDDVVADDDDDSASDDDTEFIPGFEWPDDGGGGDDPGGEVFAWDTMPRFDITLTDEAINFLHQDFLHFNVYDPYADPFEYVEAEFTYNGMTYAPIGIRLKGQNSARDIFDKPAFKVNFDWLVGGGRFLGLEAITLNNMISDCSLMHEKIGYWIFREAGIPASRANLCQVYVNGDYYGIYALIEPANEQLLERWYEDPTGSMYEGWDVDFYDQYIPDFQHQEGVDDRTPLYGVADALNGCPPGAIDAVEPYLDYDQFRRWWAVIGLVTQFDSYPYGYPGDDFNIYVEPTSGQIQFMPWGMDECFGYEINPLSNAYVYGLVASCCNNDPTCHDATVDELWSALDLAEQLDWLAVYDDLEASLTPLAAQETRWECSAWSASAARTTMRNIIANRRQNFVQYLGEP